MCAEYERILSRVDFTSIRSTLGLRILFFKLDLKSNIDYSFFFRIWTCLEDFLLVSTCSWDISGNLAKGATLTVSGAIFNS